MRERELELLSDPGQAQGPAEACLTSSNTDIQQLAKLLLMNRRMMKECPEHEFRALAGPEMLQPGELNRTHQCVHCGGRVYEAYVLVYAAERPQRDEWRRFQRETT